MKRRAEHSVISLIKCKIMNEVIKEWVATALTGLVSYARGPNI